MEIPSQIQSILKLTSNGLIWLYIGIFFIITYLFISLLTWSFLKPLKYLGIPTLITGIFLLVMRFSVTMLLEFIKLKEITALKTLLPSFLKPILYNGLLCFILGIVMIVVYIIINKTIKDKKEQPNQVIA